MKLWSGQELRRMLHIGPVTFNFNFPKIQKVFISSFADLVNTPMNPSFCFILDTPDYSKNTRNVYIRFEKYDLGKSQKRIIRKLWKRRVPTNPRGPCYFSENLDMGSISTKNIKCFFRIFSIQLEESHLPTHPPHSDFHSWISPPLWMWRVLVPRTFDELRRNRNPHETFRTE